MIAYDHSIDPPAPFVQISVQHPAMNRREILMAQLDTGADISGIPQQVIDAMDLLAARSIPIEGYDEVCVQLSTCVVALEVAGLRFHRIEVVSLPGEYALIGRDVLNHFYARLDGPDLMFDLSPDPLG
jgi:predicted aspartyl protease